MALTLKLKNRLEALSSLQHFLEGVAADRGLRGDTLFKVNLALEEIFTNIVRYGYADSREHEIVIGVDVRAGTVVVTVEDDGREFDPLQTPEVDVAAPLEARPVGGLGIHLVRHLLDGVRYERRDGRNRLTLIKKMPTQEN